MNLRPSFFGAALAVVLVPSPPLNAVEPVIAPDDGSGSIAFPVVNNPFTNSTRVRKGMQDLKTLSTGIQTEMVSMSLTSIGPPAPGGSLGGSRTSCTGVATIVVEEDSSVLSRADIPVTFVVDTAPTTPGDAQQSYAIDVFTLQGEIFGDPDFDLLRIQGGSSFGLPSPGQTTLERLGPPGSDFAVDSFFDIEYQIEFQGAPGSVLEGMGGTFSESARCEQPLKLANGVPYETTGSTVAVLTPDGIRAYGGGGGGGVIRLGKKKEEPTEDFSLAYSEIKWTYSTGPSGGLELPNDNDSLTLDIHVNPLADPVSHICRLSTTTSGGLTSTTADFSDMGATATRVEVWHLGALVGSAIVPNGTAACILPPRDFTLNQVLARVCCGMTGATRQRGSTTLGDLVVVKELDKSSPKLCSTPGGDFLGSELRFHPVGATLRVGTIGHVDHGSTTSCLFEDSSVGLLGREVRGLGNSGLSKADSKRARLKISNLGSSGCDGVSIDVGDDGHPPVRVEIEEVFTFAPTGGGGAGGSIWLHARSASGNSLGELRLQDNSGAGGGGRIVVTDFSPIGSSTVLVRVYQDELFVGERQVILSAATQVATVDDAAGGGSRITACGKNAQSPPFQFPCFFVEFDQVVPITPSGAPAALSGNRLEVLADGVSGTPDPLRFFEVLSDEAEELFVRGISHGPDDLPIWIWYPVAPTFPPSLRTVCGDVAIFDTGAGSGLPAGSEGLQFRVQIRDLVEIGPGPTGGTEFGCIVEIAAEGLGGKKGYDYYKATSASCVIDLGNNTFNGQDVQQFDTEMLSMDLVLPPDPDFDLLRVRCGIDLGLAPCPGQVTRTKLPSGSFNVDSFFDIEYQIEFQGAGTNSDFAGVSGLETFSSRWSMYQPEFIRWGLAHEPLGAAAGGRSVTGGLTISNLGSSGCDGVSIDLGGAEGATVEFEPHTMLPGASWRRVCTGDSPGSATSSVQFDITVNRHPVDSFFDISYALPILGLGGTVVQVLDDGVVVSEAPVASTSGAVRVDPVGGSSLPAILGVAVLPSSDGAGSLSYVGPCDASVFDGDAQFTVAGSPPATGDELRIIGIGGRLLHVDRLACFITDDNDLEIRQSSVIMHGRNLSTGNSLPSICYDGSWVLGWVNGVGGSNTCPSSRPYRCVDGSCAISAIACPPLIDTGVLSVSVSPRDAASGLATGKRQHKPLSLSTGGLPLVSPGDRVNLESVGTIGGVDDQVIGTLEISHAGGNLLTSVQWPYQLNASTRVLINESPLYKGNGNTGQNPLYEGVAPPGTPPVRIDASTPVLLDVCGGAPGDSNPLNRPAYLNFSFVEPVTITAPDGSTHEARGVVLIPEGQGAPPVTAVARLTLDQLTNAAYNIEVKSIFTGPSWNTGLSHISHGACTLEEDGGGRLTVSNIGSSGCDGVSIDLHQGTGGIAEWEPLTITRTGAGMTLKCVPGSPGSVGDLDRDGLLDLVVASNNDNSSCWVRVSQVHAGNVRVVCRDQFGNAVGDYILPHDDLGVCSPGTGGGGAGGTVRIKACGWLPPLVTSLGELGHGPFLRFDEEITFTPSSGVPTTCFSFAVHCYEPTDGVCGTGPGTPLMLQCLFGNLPDARLLGSEVTHFRATPYTGLGAARLRADAGPDTLTVSNIGSSGEDGVSIDLEHAGSFSTGGSGGEDKLTENVTLNFAAPVPITLNHSGGGGGGGRIAIRGTGSFDPNGGPGVPLGVCALDTDSDNDSIPIEVDFSDLGIDQCRVVVVQNGQVAGEFVESSVTAPFDVCRIYQLTALAVTGCGWQASEPDPGGGRVPYFSWGFETPVAVRPPGDPTAPPLVGDEVRLLVGGDVVSVVPQAAGTYVFDLRVTDNPTLSSLASLTLIQPPPNDFVSWLGLHFTAAEIAVLASQNFQGDFDGDGCSDVCEFIEGTNPRVAESPVGRGVAFSTVAGPADSRLIRLSYHTADVAGADVILRSTTNLQNWNEDASQFRLLSRDPQPDGRLLWQWEVVAPIGSKAREFYGHVTILK